MNSIEIMNQEHKYITRMLSVVRKKCFKILQGEEINYDDFQDILEFITSYADNCHHKKEEDILFNKMIKNLGATAEKVVKNGMLVEHDLGRLYVNGIKEALEKVKLGDNESKLDVIANAISYTHLLERHIDKEDRVIYKFAQRDLDKSILLQIDKESLEFEEKNKSEKERCLLLLNKLENKYNPENILSKSKEESQTENKMFCFQCQETAGCTGCTKFGVCGKSPDLARMQDLLVYVTKGISEVATMLRKQGEKIDGKVNHLITINLFSTITNANFDDDIFYERVKETLKIKEELISKLHNKDKLSEAALWNVAYNEEINKVLDEKSTKVGVLATKNEDIRSLRELIIYGLKGMSAYMKHANALGYDDENINAFMQKSLAKTLDDNLSIDELVALTLETGKVGVDGMALLDKANTETYGHPEMTKVNIGVRNNPGILVSGHDLKDLELLLKQTEGTGVDVYTHSEMLPAHYYPAFKKYSHFVGNYGNAWWKQKEEFESFNGPILMTTNCIVTPKDTYKDRVYTTGAAGFVGCTHIKGNSEADKDFSIIIEHAKKCKPPVEIENGEIIGGFAHNQVFALSNQIVEAVKSGAIKKFFVMAGCDGRAKSRNYYTDFAKALPQDTVILTAGCAKYKYNKLELGDINGIPRVLDAGQCNDSYSLALIALKLKEIFELEDINDLPIAYNIAWYEQKAVIVLLSLLYLGVKNIHLGPTLPAFLSPNVAKVLIENFNIGGISNVEDDLKMFL